MTASYQSGVVVVEQGADVALFRQNPRQRERGLVPQIPQGVALGPDGSFAGRGGGPRLSPSAAGAIRRPVFGFRLRPLRRLRHHRRGLTVIQMGNIDLVRGFAFCPARAQELLDVAIGNLLRQ